MAEWTPADIDDAWRSAVAMVRAAGHNDVDAIGALWDSSPNRDALLLVLCAIPGQFATAVARKLGYVVDVDDILGRLAERFAAYPPSTLKRPPRERGQ